MERKIYLDLSTFAVNSSGSAVYVWELCHRLMRLAKPLQVLPFTSPFRTVGRKGFSRVLNAILRDTIWQNILAGMETTKQDYFIFPNLTNVPRKFYNLKYAVIVYDLGAWHNRSYRRWRGKIAVRAIPEILANADTIFAISDYTAQDTANEFGIAEDKIIVAPCGLSKIYQLNAPILEQINGVQLPTNQYFLHVGNIEPRKNLSFLLKVYERFREITASIGSEIKLVLTGGETWKSNAFIKQIRNSSYASEIIILGRVKSEELPSLYRGAAAFIFPSIFEGFGMPVIEALSQGTPVLVHANTSLTQFGDFGATVFNDFEIDIWASKLKEIVLSGQRVEKSDIDKIINYFDWDRTAKIIGESIGLF